MPHTDAAYANVQESDPIPEKYGVFLMAQILRVCERLPQYHPDELLAQPTLAAQLIQYDRLRSVEDARSRGPL